MNHSDVLNEIKANKIKPVYLLYGEEVYLSHQVEEAIINAVLAPDERDMNLAVFNQDPSPQELMALIETIPFMGGKNVIIVRGTSFFKARKGNSDGEEIQVSGSDDALISILGNIPEYSHLIFSTSEKVDKRRKVFKVVETNGRAVEVAPVRLGDVRDWLHGRLAQMGEKMTADAVEHLIGAISVMPQISLGFLNNEMEKLALYSSSKTITISAVMNILSSIPEVSVFAMIDALSQKQVSKALELYNEQLAAGDHPLRILALLARQVRLLWQAKELVLAGGDGRILASRLGVPPFVGDKLVRQSRNFQASSLKQALLSLAAADYDLKAGKADGVILEKIIIEICR